MGPTSRSKRHDASSASSHAAGAPAKPAPIPALLTADSATLVFKAEPDGKIRVTYHNWDAAKTVLDGQHAEIRRGPQGVELRFLTTPVRGGEGGVQGGWGLSALHVTTRDEVLARVVGAITKQRPVSNWLGETAGDVLAIFEALGFIEFEHPLDPVVKKMREVSEESTQRTIRAVIADINVNDQVERVRHPTDSDFSTYKLGDAYASRIVYGLEKAGFKIVRAE